MQSEMNVEFIWKPEEILIRSGILPDAPDSACEQKVALTIPLTYPTSSTDISSHHILCLFGTNVPLRELRERLEDKYPLAPLALVPITPEVAELFSVSEAASSSGGGR